MNPSVQDRLDSCVRALEHVVLPALPPGAALAQEQTMLVMGHIQIIRAQLDALPAFEREDAEDFAAMASAICNVAGQEADGLREALAEPPGEIPRERTARLQTAIDELLKTYAQADGTPQRIADIICEHGGRRAKKDRAWFAAMGFDAEYSQ